MTKNLVTVSEKIDGREPVVPIEVVPVDSWRGFPDAVNSKIGEVNAGSFIFRGLRDSTFRLESSFDRLFDHLSPHQRTITNHRILAIFRATAYRSEKSVPEDEREAWALGQHFGLATRMLDWTESRYVAAFFAFASLRERYNSSLEAEKTAGGECVAVFALDVRSPLWDPDSVEVHRVVESGLNERVRRQRGLFTLNRTQFQAIEEFVADYHRRNPNELDLTALYRFDIPVEFAREALRDLSEMRISHSELFPGIEGVAREAMLSEWLNGS